MTSKKYWLLANTVQMEWNESEVDKDSFSMKDLVTGKNARENILPRVIQLTAGNTYHHRKDTGQMNVKIPVDWCIVYAFLYF